MKAGQAIDAVPAERIAPPRHSSSHDPAGSAHSPDAPDGARPARHGPTPATPADPPPSENDRSSCVQIATDSPRRTSHFTPETQAIGVKNFYPYGVQVCSLGCFMDKSLFASFSSEKEDSV
jgi:hypothetical protein